MDIMIDYSVYNTVIIVYISLFVHNFNLFEAFSASRYKMFYILLIHKIKTDEIIIHLYN